MNTPKRYSGVAVFCAFVGGAVAGGLAGILFATKSGQEVRWDLEDYAREKQRYLLMKAKNARAALDDAIERCMILLSKHEPGEEIPNTSGEAPRTPDKGHENADDSGSRLDGK
jgi:gas vesicle protein